jgi:hypothetical protein
MSDRIEVLRWVFRSQPFQYCLVKGHLVSTPGSGKDRNDAAPKRPSIAKVLQSRRSPIAEAENSWYGF